MEYQIKDKFQVARKGEMEDAEVIKIPAPTSKIFKHVSVLDQEIGKALKENVNNELVADDSPKDKEEIETSGSDLIFAMTASGFNLEKAFGAFSWILKLGGASLNETIRIEQPIIDKISYRDMKSMIGEYVENFLFTSRPS